MLFIVSCPSQYSVASLASAVAAVGVCCLVVAVSVAVAASPVGICCLAAVVVVVVAAVAFLADLGAASVGCLAENACGPEVAVGFRIEVCPAGVGVEVYSLVAGSVWVVVLVEETAMGPAGDFVAQPAEEIAVAVALAFVEEPSRPAQVERLAAEPEVEAEAEFVGTVVVETA